MIGNYSEEKMEYEAERHEVLLGDWNSGMIEIFKDTPNMRRIFFNTTMEAGLPLMTIIKNEAIRLSETLKKH